MLSKAHIPWTYMAKNSNANMLLMDIWAMHNAAICRQGCIFIKNIKMYGTRVQGGPAKLRPTYIFDGNIWMHR